MNFPLAWDEKWNVPQPLGIRAGLELERDGVPFIVNSAWDHHGADAQWIYEMINERKWPLNECREGQSKNWDEALKYIIARIKEND